MPLPAAAKANRCWCATLPKSWTRPSGNEVEMSNEVWVFVEHADGAVVRSSLEVLGEARRLADALRGSVTALLFGHAADLASTLGQHGADRVFSIVGPDLGSYDPEAYVLTITRLLATEPV